MSPGPVEPAGPDDVAAIGALEQVALGPDAWSPGLVEQGVTGALPTVHYRVVRAPGVVAYAAVSVVGDVAELQRVAVDDQHRRRGLATLLLADVVRLARAEGARRLLLEVREDNAGALALYAGAGLVELARRPRYYRDGTTAIVLKLELAAQPPGRTSPVS